MSRVTNVIITIDELPETEKQFLEHLNKYSSPFNSHATSWFQLDPVKHFGGQKVGEVAVFTAAINYCDKAVLCKHLNSFKRLIWPECAAAFINTEGEGLEIWRPGMTVNKYGEIADVSDVVNREIEKK